MISYLSDLLSDGLRSFPVPSGDERLTLAAATAQTIEALLQERRRDASGRLPARAVSTCGTYAETVRNLVRQSDAPTDLETAEKLAWAIDWAVEQDRSWRANTIQVYWAALLWAVERLALSGVLDFSDVRRLLDTLERRPVLRPATDEPRTSARKRRFVTRAELRALIAALGTPRSETRRILFGLLLYGPRIGLRPIECRWATVQGDRLLVRCAKATNGRAVAETREIVLFGFGAGALQELAEFLKLFEQAAAAAPSWTAFTERLTRALHRLCRGCAIEPIALYTLRHQAIANARVHLSRREVAAFAGHASQRTARRGYPSAGTGWGTPLACGPDPASIEAVRPLPTRRGRLGLVEMEAAGFAEADAVETRPLLEEAEVTLPTVAASDLAPRPFGWGYAESAAIGEPDVDPIGEEEAEDPSPFRM